MEINTDDGRESPMAWPILTVGALLMNQNRQCLLVHTYKWSGLWGIPGGKVQYGETLEEALTREIWEETALKILRMKYVCYQDCIEHPEFYKPRHFLLINFIAFVDNLNVILNDEADQFVWCCLENASSEYRLNQPTRILIDKIIKEKAYEW